MADPVQSELLGPVLRDVSRTFYQTLRILPKALRFPMGLAYLLARAADSIADTDVLEQSERLERLLRFRNLLKSRDKHAIQSLACSITERQKAFQGADLMAERRLIRHLPECFHLLQSFSRDDQERVVEVVTQLTIGMELDLRRFSRSGKLVALNTFDELEEYTCHVAGCVGPFWTKTCIAHLTAFHSWNSDQMCQMGIRFGKALQWTNVLRDIPRDLQNGRCYIPSNDLENAGLTPSELQNPSSYSRFKPLYHRYMDHTLEHYRAAWEYTQAIPGSCFRVRLACIWPQWIGLETLALLRRSENPLDPAHRIRIPGSRVYAIICHSWALIWCGSALDRHQRNLMQMVVMPQ